MALGSTQPLTEMSTRNTSLGLKAAGAWGWQPCHLHVLSWNQGASTSWNPQGLSRPVMGLFLLLLGNGIRNCCLFQHFIRSHQMSASYLVATGFKLQTKDGLFRGCSSFPSVLAGKYRVTAFNYVAIISFHACSHSRTGFFYRRYPTYPVVAFRPFWRKFNFYHVEIEYTHGQLYLYLRGSAVEIQNPTQWYHFGRNMTVPQPVL